MNISYIPIWTSGSAPTGKTHGSESACFRVGALPDIPSESIAMWELIGRPNSCPEAKETEYYAFFKINLFFVCLPFCIKYYTYFIYILYYEGRYR